jgi:K+-transporting ATPase A subunit
LINETVNGYIGTTVFNFLTDSQNISIFIEIFPKYGPKTGKIFLKNISLTKTNMNYTIIPEIGYNGVTLFTLSAQTPFENNSLIDKYIYYCKLIIKFKA